MHIRKIEKNDIPICAQLVQEAYSQAPYNEVFHDGTALEYIQRKFDICQNNSFVALSDNDQLLAFVMLNISTWSEGPQAILEEIVVSPENQGSGIGKELLEYAHKYLASLGVKSTMLWVKNDKRLLNFYRKQGYFVADDFVVMFKNF